MNEGGRLTTSGRGADEPITRLLVSDLDNTLYNWVDYFAPAFRAMVHVLADETSIDESELISQFSDIYAEHGTSEYPFTVQALPCLDALPDTERQALVKLAATAFGGSRRKRLRCYEGVKETLQWAQASGVEVAVVTSAPHHVVAPKLNQLGLLSLTSFIISWEGFEVPAPLRRSSPVRTRVPSYPLPRSELSPKSGAFRAAIEIAQCPPDGAAIVGDSLRTDIEPAVALGLRCYWARYGLEFEHKNRATVEMITPGGVSAVDAAYATGPVPPEVQVLNSFADLRCLLTVPQASLF